MGLLSFLTHSETCKSRSSFNGVDGIASGSAFKRSKLATALGALVFSSCAIFMSGCSSSASDDQIAASKAVEQSSFVKEKAVMTPLKANDFSSIAHARILAKAQGYTLDEHFTPYEGSTSRIYGSTSLGCIDGAQQLSDHNTDFQLQRWAYNRDYAHPLLLQYLSDLRNRTKALGLPPLIIGDLSLPTGGGYGPKSAHSSHNTGIDVDLPFDFASPRKSASELRQPKDVYIVRGSKMQKAFTKDIENYIKAAASDPRVDRIFVAPMIKQHMCNVFENQKDSGFLGKLRPWFGHQAHMHVRLKCPADSPNCVQQAPVPEGTGCGYELQSWFLPPVKSKTANTTPKKKVKKEYPAQCKIIFEKAKSS